MFIRPFSPGQEGLTLIEQIVFIVIVSVGVIGLVSVMNPMVRFSAEPMRQKQLSAIAETMLAEILHQPFTWCDPDDANASIATAATIGAGMTGCANGAADQNKGGGDLTSPTSQGAAYTETRYGTAAGTQFDNVADYGGFSSANIDDATQSNAMAGYAVSVSITRAGTTFGLSDNSAALAVTVTVTKDGQSFSLTGYRFRYAPRY